MTLLKRVLTEKRVVAFPAGARADSQRPRVCAGRLSARTTIRRCRGARRGSGRRVEGGSNAIRRRLVPVSGKARALEELTTFYDKVLPPTSLLRAG
jgi:hypothetical protein